MCVISFLLVAIFIDKNNTGTAHHQSKSSGELDVVSVGSNNGE